MRRGTSSQGAPHRSQGLKRIRGRRIVLVALGGLSAIGPVAPGRECQADEPPAPEEVATAAAGVRDEVVDVHASFVGEIAWAEEATGDDQAAHDVVRRRIREREEGEMARVEAASVPAGGEHGAGPPVDERGDGGFAGGLLAGFLAGFLGGALAISRGLRRRSRRGSGGDVLEAALKGRQARLEQREAALLRALEELERMVPRIREAPVDLPAGGPAPACARGDQVRRLAREGREPEEIAQRLRLSRESVSLLLEGSGQHPRADGRTIRTGFPADLPGSRWGGGHLVREDTRTAHGRARATG